jgi:hypothetical protein
MSGSKSKNKGKRFETEVSKLLNKMFDTTEFARTPGSGAWSGGKNALKRQGVANYAVETLRGDLITPEDFPFTVECKHYKDRPSFDKILSGNESTLDKWLSEAEYDASNSNKYPLLIFKKTHVGMFAVIPINSLPKNFLELNLSFIKYNDYIIIQANHLKELIGSVKK